MTRNWTFKVRAFLVLATAAFTGCHDELHDMRPIAYHVGFYAGGGQTRTIMQSNGLSTDWQKDDELALWAKGSSGDFVLQNQLFKNYGSEHSRGFFTSSLSAAMPEDVYTYYCCYPVPLSVEGTRATFNLPAVQDGRASGGADIMISDPEQFGPLVALPDPEDHSSMRMSMNRMMHQFRFYIPSDNEVVGDAELERILLSFPSGVAGKVTLDVVDNSVAPVLTEEVADMQINLAQKLGISGEEPTYACVAIAPKQFAEGAMLQLKAYTDEQIAIFDPIDLCARNFLGGHSTPVRLNVKELVDFAGILSFTLNSNNLGENPIKITLTAPSGCIFGDGGSNVYVYEPGREINLGEVIKFKFEEDEASFMAFSGQNIAVTYESESAIVSETVTMPQIAERGKANASMNVPYLLFEDFSCVYAEGESYGNNEYSASEREQPGSSLDGCMSHTGWNAARYWTIGNAIRINTRYQLVKVVMSFDSYHYGRLDTPPLSAIKSGKTVNLSMEFDAGGYTHSSSSIGLTDHYISIATHTNQGVVDGIPTGKTGINNSYSTTISDFGSTYDKFSIGSSFGENDFGATFPTYTSLVPGVSSSTRICFYPSFTVESSGSFKSGNAEYNVYIDNIKVKIAK